MNSSPIIVRELGQQDYRDTWQAMRRFTDERNEQTSSEIWLLSHSPVFTQGQAGKAEHLLEAGEIPVVQSDRGGQITYHGPGQLIMYLLLDLKQTGKGIRGLVSVMENSIIELLSDHGIDSYAKKDAPGVYVAEQKIAALGLRVRRGFTYHGLALNVDMDLAPFQRINPCGYAGQEVTQLKNLGIEISLQNAGKLLVEKFTQQLDYEPQWTKSIPDHD